MKKGFKGDIENLTLGNTNYRQVVYTSTYSQLVLMCLAPDQDIGFEVHEANDQFFRFEEGMGKVVINETEYVVKNGDAVVVPAGARHNVINTSSQNYLKLYTIYSPPHHKDRILRSTKEEAEKDSPEFDGVLTEA